MKKSGVYYQILIQILLTPYFFRGYFYKYSILKEYIFNIDNKNLSYLCSKTY